MTRVEQKEFVLELSRQIAFDICELIDEDRIPEDWDGHEFRVLLAEHHGCSAAMSQIRKEPQRSRAREYRNVKVVNNLV